MYIADQTLEIMADYFQLNEVDKALFVEQIRSLEAETIFKSFLVYYETHKSALELKYLEMLGEGLAQAPSSNLPKFRDLFVAELSNNPELQTFLTTKVIDLMTDIIKAFTKGKDRELVREIVYSLFPNRDLYDLTWTS